MNKEILNLIKRTINEEKQNNIDIAYYEIWKNILILFKQKTNTDRLVIWFREKQNNDYTLSYNDKDEEVVEKHLTLNKYEKEKLYKMLLDDGFKITDWFIYISKSKILEYANQDTVKETKRKVLAVPSEPINMLDTLNIKHKF